MTMDIIPARQANVAPARERGLKYVSCKYKYYIYRRRSREGAWIEIITLQQKVSMSFGRSREGAWIEIGKIVRYIERRLSLP